MEDLEVRFTENGEVADIKDRVRPDVLRSQTVMVKNLAKEKRPGGAKTSGNMFSKADYFVTSWSWADFVTCSAPMNLFLKREKLTRL